MKQRIAVVGNREGFTYECVECELDKLIDVTDNVTLISGGARGVDTIVERYARQKGLRMLVIYPDPKKKSPDRYFERNKEIVDECNLLIAFNKKERSGTINTINEAKRQNKAIFLHGGKNENN